MNKLRFILAFPLIGEGRTRSDLVRVQDPEHVLDLVPKFWIADDAPLQKLGAVGVVIGHLFANQSDQTIKDFGKGGTQCSQTPFHHLVAHFWGAYFGIHYDAARSMWAVMADPSGLLPVYLQQTRQHAVFASEPALFRLQGLPRPAVEWPRLADFLARPELRERRTCLAGIEEVRPGAMIELGGPDRSETPVWLPDAFLPGNKPVAFEGAVEELRDRTSHVINAWARKLPKTVVAVSGGVDSSLICAALAVNDHHFGCVTMATADRSGDERVYAQQLAAHLGVPLEEHVYDVFAFDPLLSASAGQARPHRRLFSTAFDAMLTEAAHVLDKTTILDGNGGDNLFCFLHSAAPIIDRWRSGAGLRATIDTMIDMCGVTGCDIPTMVRASLRRLNKQVDTRWPTDNSLLLGRWCSTGICEPLTPWLTGDFGRQPGKRDHLALIMRAQNHIHGFGPGPPRFSPLMSQPLVELCLGVPTWLWPRGGRNRALARMAFAQDLPPAILARTSKAGPDSFVRGIFRQHRSAFRELLLDGELATNQILDREAVERAMDVDTSHPGSTICRMLDLAEAENWVRSWS